VLWTKEARTEGIKSIGMQEKNNALEELGEVWMRRWNPK
jgi:hypothetical protein